MRLLIPAATAIVLTVASAVSFARGAEARAGDLTITDAWARATPPGATIGAGYLTIVNNGAADDVLVGAASPAAGSVGLHETREENGVASMRPVTSAPIAAGAALEMAPGGLHLMLTALKAPLLEGQSMPLTLTFQKAGAVALDLTIAPIGASGPGVAHHDHPM